MRRTSSAARRRSGVATGLDSRRCHRRSASIAAVRTSASGCVGVEAQPLARGGALDAQQPLRVQERVVVAEVQLPGAQVAQQPQLRELVRAREHALDAPSQRAGLRHRAGRSGRPRRSGPRAAP